MQFKHPEILWALLLLLIPIIIHLLQLRRFKKTPFTNVAMLQKVVSESRKSQNLKKWLLLLTRLFLLTALVMAFAQPFSSRIDALTKRETVIYLDNSFSMQAKKDGLSLLRKSVQELVQEIPETVNFTLFTNTQTFKNVTIKQVRNELLSLESSSTQSSLDQIRLKASSLLSQENASIKNVVLVSDLQGRTEFQGASKDEWTYHLVQTVPDKISNIYIDSLYLGQINGTQQSLNVQVVGLANEATVPISLYNRDKLIAKTAVKGNTTEKAISTLTIEKGESINGRVVIEDPVLRYDNYFFFNIDQRVKPKVLAITQGSGDFLERIYSQDYFEFQQFELSTLNYSLLKAQNTIILNGLESIPNSLSTSLLDFSKNGGTLVVIPPSENIEISSYNQLLRAVAAMELNSLVSEFQDISKISFQHPLYQNVFEKEITNFDYPKVNTFYRVSSNNNAPLSFTDGSPFLVSNKDCFIFTASLGVENSNFINSPLVVPTFYNIGETSLKNPMLFQTMGSGQRIDVPKRLGQDNILKLRNGENEFVPLQQSFSNKVELQFDYNPKKDGIYAILDGNDTIQNLSFNYSRDESRLKYLDGNSLEGVSRYSNISNLFEKLREDTSITDYWKWFVIFALLFAVLELLIQKFLP